MIIIIIHHHYHHSEKDGHSGQVTVGGLRCCDPESMLVFYFVLLGFIKRQKLKPVSAKIQVFAILGL